MQQHNDYTNHHLTSVSHKRTESDDKERRDYPGDDTMTGNSGNSNKEATKDRDNNNEATDPLSLSISSILRFHPIDPSNNNSANTNSVPKQVINNSAIGATSVNTVNSIDDYSFSASVPTVPPPQAG